MYILFYTYTLVHTHTPTAIVIQVKPEMKASKHTHTHTFVCVCVCVCTYMPSGIVFWYCWRERCQTFSAEEPLIVWLFCGKWPIKIRHLMGLRQTRRSECVYKYVRYIYIYSVYSIIYIYTCTYAPNSNTGTAKGEGVWTAVPYTCTNTFYMRIYILLYMYTHIYIYIWTRIVIQVLPKMTVLNPPFHIHLQIHSTCIYIFYSIYTHTHT